MDQQFARQGIPSNPRYDQNRLGATVGGPIKKDKLFYFGNFEYASAGPGVYHRRLRSLAPTAQGYALLDR